MDLAVQRAMLRWSGLLGFAFLWPMAASAAPLPCTGGVEVPPEAVVIRSGERAWSALRRTKFEPEEISRALATLGSIAYIGDLAPGTELFVRRDAKARLASLELHYTPGVDQCAERVRGSFKPRTIELPALMSPELVEAERGAGPTEVSVLVDAIFGAPKEGRYRALIETYFVETSRVGYGKVLAATWVDSDGVASTAYAFTSETGEVGYYDAAGTPVPTHGFSSPVPTAIMTSGFGIRKHPVSHAIKTHFGVDYAAPVGTPVHAPLDGTITVAKRDGKLGNMISIDHGNGLVSRYGHMSRFARGVKAGRAVKQGTLIGYIGQTGIATGPHLHFEAMVDGRPIDARRLEGKTPAQLSALDKVRFLAEAKQFSSRLVPFMVAATGAKKTENHVPAGSLARSWLIR